ncbi:MAG: error-prone DNA polymerase [Gammaproteobacteria bacterium]|nr:error-prone DNA polymerase [Gammaproteobacteria bacterium]
MDCLDKQSSLPEYAELHCLSNFSFLRGASHPEELVQQAKLLGYTALAITDECSVAGVVRAHQMAKSVDLKLIIGSEFILDDSSKLILLASDRSSYGKLSQLITFARNRTEKGAYEFSIHDLESHGAQGCLALWAPQSKDVATGYFLKELFPDACWIAFEHHLNGRDFERLKWLQSLSRQTGMPLAASGDVHMHCRSRRALQDTLTAIRFNQPIHEVAHALYPNGERHLRQRNILAGLYPPELLKQTVCIADRCSFSLDELHYEYPDEIVPPEHTPVSWLRELTYRGANKYWPKGIAARVKLQLEYELKLISELSYEPYFLTIYDVVEYARSQNILCQGRGSAANSAVCYCLGITAVDPAQMQLLFERFISRERQEPPDIDVDFEHERREEVIQYLYTKYGRHRTAIAATVVTYRLRSAVRDVGKALGLRLDQIERISQQLHFWVSKEEFKDRVVAAGFDANNHKIKQLLTLSRQILGFPRHLSQHTGGFVIARDNLSALVPIENARMPERTVIQWDKNDLEALGLIKVDVLALGMLTAIRKAFGLIKNYSERHWSLDSIPVEDAATYKMIQAADTVGTFQIESRAQMSMLPRLKPRNYYDLVIQVAIVRPGPIQGDMVHPYLQRRADPEQVEYPSPELKNVLQRTLGVPIFQEQVMQIAIVAAGFTAGEADQLRRAMAAWKRKGGMEPFEEKLKSGLLRNGYSETFADQIFRQILGFGDYGFPESHAASFALLAYISAWLKCHEPAAFCCALLNSQPLGFYAPAQLIEDAKRHGVEIRAIDVCFSDWDCTLEKDNTSRPALRLGMRMVKSLKQSCAERIVAARQLNAFSDLTDLAERCHISSNELTPLAAADALLSLSGHRRRAYWQAAGIEVTTPLLGQPRFNESLPMLSKATAAENLVADYVATGCSAKMHPMRLLRERFSALGVTPARKLSQRRNGSIVKVAGLVTHRQRPGTASGVIFITLEDETGFNNIIVWPKVADAQRVALLDTRLMLVAGLLQIEQNVAHIVAGKINDYSNWLNELNNASRDFR